MLLTACTRQQITGAAAEVVVVVKHNNIVSRRRRRIRAACGDRRSCPRWVVPFLPRRRRTIVQRVRGSVDPFNLIAFHLATSPIYASGVPILHRTSSGKGQHHSSQPSNHNNVRSPTHTGTTGSSSNTTRSSTRAKQSDRTTHQVCARIQISQSVYNTVILISSHKLCTRTHTAHDDYFVTL